MKSVDQVWRNGLVLVSGSEFVGKKHFGGHYDTSHIKKKKKGSGGTEIHVEGKRG